jgi:hypothetical protein
VNSKSKFVLTAVVMIFLSACADGGTTDQNAPEVVLEEVAIDKVAIEEFPEEALVKIKIEEVVAEVAAERSEVGVKRSNESYYLNMVLLEETVCLKRRIDIMGSLSSYESEQWQPGLVNALDTQRKSVTVEIIEDLSECGGGIYEFRGTTHAELFEFDSMAESVRLYAEVPVYGTASEQSEQLVTIFINSSQVATDERSGGHTYDETDTEWTEGFSLESTYFSEGANILIDGGVSVDQLPVMGSIFAKFSKSTSSSSQEGSRSTDPFISTYQGGKG